MKEKEQIIHNLTDALKVAQEKGTSIVSSDVRWREMEKYRETSLGYGVYLIDGIVYNVKQHGVYDQLYGEYADQEITCVPKEIVISDINNKITELTKTLNKLK